MSGPFRYKKLDDAIPRVDEEPNGVNDEDEEGTSDVQTTVISEHSSSVNTNEEKSDNKPVAKIYKCARFSFGIGILVTLVCLMIASIAIISVAPSCDLAWWRTTVIYQCYPQSFQDSNGDGIGDLQGILQRASYFSDIGINAVWLNPIFDSPQQDAGYDVSNYTAIYPKYGTLAQLKALMDELHKRGVHLLLDFVPNHTSDKHPWFTESRSSKTNSKRDWYVWADPAKDGRPPNNWISVFGGSAWQLDNLTNQYYLHQFSVFQPDLNYNNPAVRKAMVDVLKYWLDFGVDGFRVDAVIYLLEDTQLRNEVRNPNFTSPNNSCIQNITSRMCYQSLVHNLTANLPGIHEIFREWRAVVDSYGGHGKEKLLIGEVYGSLDTVVSYYGHNNEFTFPFNFFLIENSNWTGTSANYIVSCFMSQLPEGAWPNWVLGNHDNSRISSRAGVYLARALNVLLLTLPGTPTTYYGEEILMTDVAVPDSKKKDVYEDRDKERTPMQWNSSINAGFTVGSPWLPLSPDFAEYNVKFENSSNTSMLALYKKLVHLRSTQTAFQALNYLCVNASEEIYAYLRFVPDDSQQYLVVINFSEKNQVVQLDVGLSDTVIELSSTLKRNGTVDLSSQLQLAGGEALVISGTGKDSCEDATSNCPVCNATMIGAT